jgi:type IV secretory pathway TraG/TraD family ATPase VirD4
MGLLWFGSKKPKSRAPNTGAHGEERWGNESDLEKIGAFEKCGLPVGFLNGRQFCHPARRKPHAVVISNTGGGKTLSAFVPVALSAVADKMSLVAVDTASDFSSIVLPHRSTLGECWRLDPADMMHGRKLGSTKRGRYNPMGEFLRRDDRLRFPTRSQRLAGMCVGLTDGHDKFFYKMARRAMRGGIMALAKHGPPEVCNLPSVAKVFNDDFFAWVRWILNKSIDPFISDLLRPFLTEPGKEHEIKSLVDVVNTVASDTDWILNEALSESMMESDCSFTRLGQEVGTIVLNCPLDLLDEDFDRWLTMTLHCALSQLQTERNKVPVVFILDELKQYV